MTEHDLVPARDYTPDGERHCDGCGAVMGYDTPNGWGGELTLSDTGTIVEWRVSVKASPFRGTDICRGCIGKALECASLFNDRFKAGLD